MYINHSKDEPRENQGEVGVRKILKDKFIYFPREERGKDLQTRLFCTFLGALPARQVKRGCIFFNVSKVPGNCSC